MENVAQGTPAPQEQIQKIELELASLRQRVEAMTVATPEQYIGICNLVLEGRGFIKRWKGVYAEPLRSAKEHVQLLQNEEKLRISGAEIIVAIAEKKGEGYKAEERRKAQIEQDRINEERRLEAAAKAEAERKERERIAEEQRKLAAAEAEKARKAGEIGKREADRRKKEAEEAAQRERDRAAADAKVAAANVQEVKVAPSVPKVAGIKARVNYKFKIVDETKIPREYLMPDEVKIGAAVRQAKKVGEIIPGIEAYSEDSI
jgi:hypothetical protein